MKRASLLLACACLAAGTLSASWYWPFEDEDEAVGVPRLSVLMKPASVLIDEASDCAGDGDVDGAVKKYREALLSLDEIELRYADVIDKDKFSSLRNKRAFVNAAIDALLLKQIRDNARAVAVTDTTALEARLAQERAPKKPKSAVARTNAVAKVEKAAPPAATRTNAVAKVEKTAPPAVAQTNAVTKAAQPEKGTPPERPIAKRALVLRDISKGDYAAAELGINEMLAANKDDTTALNLKAALEMARGNPRAAEDALDAAIARKPREPAAYYNMAELLLARTPPDKDAARRYYESGRAFGGRQDKDLEAALK